MPCLYKLEKETDAKITCIVFLGNLDLKELDRVFRKVLLLCNLENCGGVAQLVRAWDS
jgi:hypothetical protein